MSANRQSHHVSSFRSWILASGLALASLGADANPVSPTNLQLITAMPPGTESVIVQRLAILRSEESPLRAEYAANLSDDPGNNIKTVVTNALWRAVPVVWALGGSDFEVPPDSGMSGNFNERAVILVEQPLHALRKELETGGRIDGFDESFEYEGVEVFKGTNDERSVRWGKKEATGEPWFVALLNVHTVVSAETRADIEYMLSSLKSKEAAVPFQWRSIAEGHDLESPIVILRTYPTAARRRQHGKRLFLPPEEAKATYFALELADLKTVTFKISIAASDMEVALRWHRYSLGEEALAWNLKPTSTGVTGTIELRQGFPLPGEPLHMPLRLIVAFGVCVVI